MRRSDRIPRPLPSRDPAPTDIRRPCPLCGAIEAEVLFQAARCLNASCRNYDAALKSAVEETRLAGMAACFSAF